MSSRMPSRPPAQPRPPTSARRSRWSRVWRGLVTASLLVLTLALVVPVPPGAAQSPPTPAPDPAAAGLTQELVALAARYRLAGAAERARLLGDLLRVAATRQQLLAALIEGNPGEVLRVALPADFRASLPAAAQAYVEEEVEIEGELEILHEDGDEESRYLYFLGTAGQRFSLHFVANPPMHLLTGTQVRAKGVQVDEALALSSGSTSIQTLSAAALPNTFGAQQTAVFLVNFQDNPTDQPLTLDQAYSLVFGTVSDFYLENSFQQTWLSGDVYGWYTTSVLSTTCDTSTMASEAQNAATAAGADLSLYTRFVYMFPMTRACTWAGLAWIGGSPSQVFINGAFSLRVVGHELGHNLGLFHAHGLNCDTSPLGANCSSLDTGDRADIMGGRAGHFNAFSKEYLGWLNNDGMPPITTVESSGSYTLDPYESHNSNPKALKILKNIDVPTGERTWYYLEYRQPLGFDSILNGVGNLVSGVSIRTGSETYGVGSYELDMTPNSVTSSGYGDLEDGALAVGQTFTDSAAGVTVTTRWADSTGASVDVTIDQPCGRANPSVSISPAQSSSVAAGTPVAYTVAVTNNDSASCGLSLFNLQASVPSGWSGAFAAPTLALSPGVSASTILTVTSPASATGGSYDVGVITTNNADPGYAASATATYVVSSTKGGKKTGGGNGGGKPGR